MSSEAVRQVTLAPRGVPRICVMAMFCHWALLVLRQSSSRDESARQPIHPRNASSAQTRKLVVGRAGRMSLSPHRPCGLRWIWPCRPPRRLAGQREGRRAGRPCRVSAAECGRVAARIAVFADRIPPVSVDRRGSTCRWASGSSPTMDNLIASKIVVTEAVRSVIRVPTPPVRPLAVGMSRSAD